MRGFTPCLPRCDGVCGMEMQPLELKLHPEMVKAASHMAAARDVTMGQLVRDLLAREIARNMRARPPIRADERLIAPLRARLAGDLAHATGWDDLQSRLMAKGYALREAGGGLALHTAPGGQRVCKASELGFGYARLMRRFGAPFPGHAHSWLAERMLGADTHTDTPDETSDFDVIEPF